MPIEPIDWSRIPTKSKAERDRIHSQVVARIRANAAEIERAHRERRDGPGLLDIQAVAAEIAREQTMVQAVQRADQFSRMPFRDRLEAVLPWRDALVEAYHAKQVKEAREYGQEPPTKEEAALELRERLLSSDENEREAAALEVNELAPGFVEQFGGLQAEAPVRRGDALASAKHRLAGAIARVPATSTANQALEDALNLAGTDEDPVKTAPARVAGALARTPEGRSALVEHLGEHAIDLAYEADELRAEDAARNPEPEPLKDVPTEALEGFMDAKFEQDERERAREESHRRARRGDAPDFVYEDSQSEEAVAWLKADIERMDKEDAALKPKKDGNWDQYFRSA